MSDAPKDEKKDDKSKAAAAPAAGKKPGLGGPIAAVAVILLAGVGIGFFLSSLVKPAPKPAAEGKEAGAETGKDAHGAEAGKDAHGASAGGHAGAGSLLHSSAEFDLGDLMSNIRGQQGRRFIKMSCVVWLDAKVQAKVAGGGGGHGGGATPGENVKRIIQAAFEEHLKSYDLDDLTGINIYKLLEKGFKEIAERELRGLYPEFATQPTLVSKIVLTNMLVQ